LLEEAEQSYPDERIADAVGSLLESQAIVALQTGKEVTHDWRHSDAYLATGPAWAALRERLQQVLADFHHAHPLRRGLPRPEAMTQLGIATPRLFDAMISTATREGIVRDDGATIGRPDFQITLPRELRTKADAYITQLRQRPFTPPSPREAGLDPETVGALADRGEVVLVGEDVVFDPDAYAQIGRETIQFIQSNGSVNLAQFRDTFATSRKYAQSVLEYLDRQKITRRIGDEHVLGPAASGAPDRRQMSRQGDVK
jgi:selenocysteine-specific elongation factor